MGNRLDLFKVFMQHNKYIAYVFAQLHVAMQTFD